MNQAEYDAIEAYMLARMLDGAHDTQHVYRVLFTALDLAQDDPEADLDVLIAACLLHDVGREAQFRDRSVCHARVGADMARAFLRGLGWPEARAGHAADCVRTHRYRGDDEPQSLEAKLLFDANKLDAAGAVGVARTLVYTGIVGRAIYAPEDLAGDLPGRRTNSFVGEYRYKLQNVYDRLYTDRARNIANARRRAAVGFYESLMDELTGPTARGEAMLSGWLSPADER
jgi:uncharacterized protein